uniref:Secreted protein n=1 Tax=Macrostomum lignano TaxID=282301 RepID=A0A1I8F7Q4_9PLAT
LEIRLKTHVLNFLSPPVTQLGLNGWQPKFWGTGRLEGSTRVQPHQSGLLIRKFFLRRNASCRVLTRKQDALIDSHFRDSCYAQLFNWSANAGCLRCCSRPFCAVFLCRGLLQQRMKQRPDVRRIFSRRHNGTNSWVNKPFRIVIPPTADPISGRECYRRCRRVSPAETGNCARFRDGSRRTALSSFSSEAGSG